MQRAGTDRSILCKYEEIRREMERWENQQDLWNTTERKL